MKKIKLLSQYCGPKGSYKADTEIDIAVFGKAEAEMLVKGRYAEYVGQPVLSKMKEVALAPDDVEVAAVVKRPKRRKKSKPKKD